MKTRIYLACALAILLFLIGGIWYVATRSPSSSAGLGYRRAFRFLGAPQETPRSPADKDSVKHVWLVDPHAHPEQTQLVSLHPFLWAVSTERLLCISQPRGAACASKWGAARRGVLLATFQPPTPRQPKPHDFLLQGLVPDDVNEVAVVIGKLQHQRVVVTRNTFSVKRDKPVRLLRLIRK
jgi:hypothetical protein